MHGERCSDTQDSRLLLYPRTSGTDIVGNGGSLMRRELTRQLTNTVVDRQNSGNEWQQTTEYCGGQQYHLQSNNERM